MLCCEVFSRHYRKVKAIFGLTDVLLVTLAFIAAYQTRIHLHFEKQFYLDFPVAATLLVVSVDVLGRDRLLVQRI